MLFKRRKPIPVFEPVLFKKNSPTVGIKFRIDNETKDIPIKAIDFRDGCMIVDTVAGTALKDIEVKGVIAQFGGPLQMFPFDSPVKLRKGEQLSASLAFSLAAAGIKVIL